MRQSETLTTLAPALVAAQAEIGGAVKGSENPFFKSRYADLNAVIMELKPIFVKHGFAVIQLPCSDENGVGVMTRVQHTSGEYIEERFTLPLAKKDPQAAGSAITYAKRYALKALGLMPDLDDDGEAAMFRQVEEFTEAQKHQFDGLIANNDGFGLKKFGQDVGSEVMEALFNAAPQGQKTKVKQKCRDVVNAANKVMKETVANFEAIVSGGDGDAGYVVEALAELEGLEREFVIAAFDDILKRQIEDLTGETL